MKITIQYNIREGQKSSEYNKKSVDQIAGKD
jgi:hypothetical protein